jgi:hypothetical protein
LSTIQPNPVSIKRRFGIAKNREELVELLGAKIVGEVPDVGGGAFGMARLAYALMLAKTASDGEQDKPSEAQASRQRLIS